MKPRVPVTLFAALNLFFEDRGVWMSSHQPHIQRGISSLKVTFGEGHTFYQVVTKTSLSGRAPTGDTEDLLYDGFVRAFRRRLRRGDFKFSKRVLSLCRAKDVRRQ